MCTNNERLPSLRLSNLSADVDQASMQIFSDSTISLSTFASLKRKPSFVCSKRK